MEVHALCCCSILQGIMLPKLAMAFFFQGPAAEAVALSYLFLHVSHNALEGSDGPAPWCTL